jgi:hypothetical protein
MDELGHLTAKATVSVGGASKAYRFRAVTRSAKPNRFVKLRLRLKPRALRAVKRALGRHKRLRAKVTVIARDLSNNQRSKRATIRLKD